MNIYKHIPIRRLESPDLQKTAEQHTAQSPRRRVFGCGMLLAACLSQVVCQGAPSGQSMPVGDLPGWKQIFTDDFTTTVPVGSFPAAVSTKWGAYPDGWHDTSGNGTYYPSKVVSIGSGLMNLYIHTENGVHMVSAPTPTLPGGSSDQLYGRYVVRFRADALSQYKTAWLLWPQSGVWPRDGEIDFPEGNLNSTIGAFMHHQGGTSGGDQDAFGTSVTYTSWHTAVLEWKPLSVTFILDGVTIGTSTTRIPNTPMHMVLQTETALSGGAPANSTAGNVQLDWIAIYSYCPTCTGAPIPNGTYKVVARHSGKALDVTSQGTANGVNVQQWTYGGGNNQRWALTQLSGSQYKIIGVQSGRALDVAGQSTADGANIQIWDWLTQNNQKWTITPTSGGYNSVISVNSGKGLDVYTSSTADGANVQQWTYSGSNNQQWGFQTP